ncbi:hypothetical protein O181_108000 [Austropuccinia psidii MF-1]|uniref:Uncharacterized protein n=1 Tax=Austropuccinia psidii MF-1 TaxID=1389203 RepID=A0A9Q3JVL4_9BASI|nr:hypothetical protein [Austropuccinia psidii MF-1]
MKTIINEIEIGNTKETKKTNDSAFYESNSDPSEEEELPAKLGLEKLNVSFEVTEMHTHLPHYSYECMDLIQVQDAKMQKAKTARGKGFKNESSLITDIVIENNESKIHLDSGAL